MQQGKQQPQNHPADGPAFWNITTNFKPGELESDMIKMLYSTGIDLQKENEVLKNRINHLEDALRRIANQDYRGNRSTESQIAFEALKEAKL
jgi:hypothetical protein